MIWLFSRSILFYMFSELVLFENFISGTNSLQTEEFTFKIIDETQNKALKQIDIFISDGLSPENNYDIFPKNIQSLLNASSIESISFGIGNGRVSSKNFEGLFDGHDFNGAYLKVTSKPENYASVWRFVSNSIESITQIPFSSIDTASVISQSIGSEDIRGLKVQKKWIYGTISNEYLCVDNIKSIFKLFPCRDMGGLLSILNVYDLLKAQEVTANFRFDKSINSNRQSVFTIHARLVWLEKLSLNYRFQEFLSINQFFDTHRPLKTCPYINKMTCNFQYKNMDKNFTIDGCLTSYMNYYDGTNRAVYKKGQMNNLGTLKESTLSLNPRNIQENHSFNIINEEAEYKTITYFLENQEIFTPLLNTFQAIAQQLQHEFKLESLVNDSTPIDWSLNEHGLNKKHLTVNLKVPPYTLANISFDVLKNMGSNKLTCVAHLDGIIVQGSLFSKYGIVNQNEYLIKTPMPDISMSYNVLGLASTAFTILHGPFCRLLIK